MAITLRDLQHAKQNQTNSAAKMAEFLQMYGEYERMQKNDPTTVGGVAPYLHGNDSTFGLQGLSPNVFSTFLHADSGLLSALPIMNRPFDVPDADPAYGGINTPFLTTFTGVTSGDGDAWDNQPDEPCDDPPVGGLMKVCTLTAPYGRFSISTRQLDIKRVGDVSNRGEFTDLRFVGNVNRPDNHFSPQGTSQPALINEVQSRYFEAGVSLQRLIAPLVYTGSPTNNKANGGAAQFIGLDTWINTDNKVDVVTSAVCESMNSLVIDFGGNNVDEADTRGNYVFDYLEQMVRWARSEARRTGLGDVELAFVMRESLFYELTRYIGIQQYNKVIAMLNTINGGAAGNGILNADASSQFELTQTLRQGMYLPIEGLKVPVIFDDGIAESADGSEYQSTIYMVPLRVSAASTPVTYWDFYNFDNGNARQVVAQLAKGEQIWFTDNGRFIWTYDHKNGCITAKTWTQPRLMMHTTNLAARLDSVNYEPVVHLRDAYPDDINYYNGGGTSYPANSYYRMDSPSTPVTNF